MQWRNHPLAPRPGSLLCDIGTVPDGACVERKYGEGNAAFSVLIYRRGEDVHAYVNLCPHFGLPLNSRPGEFLVYGQGLLMCAHHSAVFRLEDGHCVQGLPPAECLQTVPIRRVGSYIYLDER